MDSQGEEIIYDEVDTPSYRTRLKEFVDRYMTDALLQDLLRGVELFVRKLRFLKKKNLSLFKVINFYINKND